MDSNSHELEYNALRDEILKRIELRYQIIGLNLTILAAIFALAATKEGNPALVLIHPPIAALLAIPCASNEASIEHLVKYIRIALEPRLGLGWEEWVGRKRDQDFRFRSLRSPFLWDVLVLLITQIIALLVGLYMIANFDPMKPSLGSILFWIDIISIAALFVTGLWWRFCRRRG